MSDMEDSWLAAAGGVSIGLLGLCILVSFVRQCRKPRMKPSRSDTDLTQLTVEPSEEQYALPLTPASTASSHTAQSC